MSISSIAKTMKKAVTVLVGAALFAGSLVAVTPASAAASNAKQPAKTVDLGESYTDDTQGRVVVKDGWIYTLAGLEGSWNAGKEVTYLKRTKVSTFGTTAALTLMAQSETDDSKSKMTVGDTVTKLYHPISMDVVGNSIFVLDVPFTDQQARRLIQIDLTGATDSSANLTGTIIASTGSGLDTGLSGYGNVKAMAAASESEIYIANMTHIFKVTKSGSTWSSDAGTDAGDYVWGLKMAADGKLVVATQAGFMNDASAWTFSFYNTSNLTTATSTATLAADNNNSLRRVTTDFAIDPANNDILFIQNYGSVIQRMVKGGNGTYGSPQFEAMGGSDNYTATSLVPASPASANGYNFYEATISESTAGIQVGVAIDFGDYGCPSTPSACYFNGPSESTVSAVNGNKITIKTTGMVSGQGYTSVKLSTTTYVSQVAGITYDATVGLVALDRGGNWQTGNHPSRVVTFKSRSTIGGVSGVGVIGGHKILQISHQQPAFVADLVSIDGYIFQGDTAAAALTAATAHSNPGNPVCVWNLTGTGVGGIYADNYKSCTLIDGITAGKYYGVAYKVTAIDGSEVWNVGTRASQVTDSAISVTLPTDPDPASSNVGPGYAHQGESLTSASDLVSSGYRRVINSDGRGGQYIAFLVGTTFKNRIKVVHVLANGTIDTTFGTSGVLDPSAQGLSSDDESNRDAGFAWFSTGKFLYLDRDNTSNSYNVVPEDGSAMTLSATSLNTLCATAFPGALNTNNNSPYADSIQPVSAASSDPVVQISCNATYALTANDYNNRRNFYRTPVFAKVTGTDSLTLLASSISGVTDYTEAAAVAKPCIGSFSYRNTVIAKAEPGAGEPLFTALLTETDNCDNWNAVKTAWSLQVNADGTSSRVSNNLPTDSSSTIEASWVTSTGKVYLNVSQGMSSAKLYRLTDEGVLDTSFGTAGAKTITAPVCAGTYRLGLGISETQSGDVYFNALAWANQVYSSTPTNSNVYPFAVLLEKGSNNTADLGTTYLGATLSYSSLPEQIGNYWNDFGIRLTTSTVDAAGNISLLYYGGAAGLKSIKIDSFASALPAGDDYIECPPSPFEAVSASAPFMTESFSTVQLTNGSVFAYNTIPSGSDAGKAVVYAPGANSNLKGGTFELTEASLTVHAGGWAVALPGNKVMVGGGRKADYTTNRTIEIYDPAADAGSRWTALTGEGGATNLLATKVRRGAVAQLLGNGKVLVFGGYDGPGYTDGELVSPGATNASTVTEAFADAGTAFSNVISAGAGKWLLFGASDRFAGTVTAGTKIYTESTNALTAGPNLGAARTAPAVASLGGTKTLIAGDNTQMMGPNTPMTGMQTFDVYDSATNKITTTTLKSGYFSAGYAGLLPSGKVLLVQTMNNMNPAQSKVLDMTAATTVNGEMMPNGLTVTKLFRFGDKTLLAGGRNISGGMGTPSWLVFTEPAAVVGALTVDARKVLKGTTGNMVVTAGVNMTIGSGNTALTVSYANAVGSTVLKTSPTPNISGSKLKLDATGRLLTAPLPTVAQINASATGAVVATVKQGTTVLGTVTINYVAAKDVPVFTTQVSGTIPGMVSSLPLAVSTSAGNGVPTLSYKSTTTKVCTVNASGTVTRVSRGVCKVTVSQAADLGTAAKSQDYTLTFAKSNAVLAFGGDTPAAGNIDLTEDDIQLELAATVDGAPAANLDVTYSVDNDDKCSVDEDGVFNTLATGSCTVTATFAGDANITGPVSTTRQFTIVTPSTENPGTVGGVIGDAVFEESDDPADTMLAVSMNTPKHLKRTIKLGRGWKIVYTPTLKAKTTNVVTGATFLPTMTSAYIGSMTTTFLVPKTAFAKTPAGWKVVGTNYSCAMTYGSKTQVAANKKIKTVVTKGKTCALPALTAAVQVKVKNNWTRLAQKKGSPALTAQKRTAKINLQ